MYDDHDPRRAEGSDNHSFSDEGSEGRVVLNVGNLSVEMQMLINQALPEDTDEEALGGDEELRLAGSRLMAKLRKQAVRSNEPEVCSPFISPSFLWMSCFESCWVSRASWCESRMPGIPLAIEEWR